VETNATRMCALLVGLPDVSVLAVDDLPGEPIRVHVEQHVARPSCPSCEAAVWVKDRPVVELVDLPCFGRPARLVWHKHRWRCPTPGCPVSSWTGQDPTIAAARLAMTDRAGRWATTQVGRHGRTVNEVAGDLGCDWHTVNDAVMAYGTPLVEDPEEPASSSPCLRTATTKARPLPRVVAPALPRSPYFNAALRADAGLAGS
jgi:transposase